MVHVIDVPAPSWSNPWAYVLALLLLTAAVGAHPNL